MSIIEKYPSGVLLSKSKRTFRRELAPILNKLRDSYHTHPCVGVAAPQVGVGKQVFIAQGLFYINPVMIRMTEPYKVNEGCLSLDARRIVTRYRKITLRYTNTLGKRVTETFEDFKAEVIQHEYDHLQGQLLIHKAT